MEKTPKIMTGIHGKVQSLENTVYYFGFYVQKYEVYCFGLTYAWQYFLPPMSVLKQLQSNMSFIINSH